MIAAQPQRFSYLYANDRAPGQSLDEIIDLKTCEGHVMRCSQTKDFLYFPDIIQLNNYFIAQKKPYLHSVINKHRPVRFNLELDMPTDLLDNIIFPKATLVKIEQDGLDLNLIKSLKCLEHVQETAFDILEEFGVEMTEYKYMVASDNRREKFSYRMYLKLAFQNMREYKHFISILKEKVRPEVLPMIDPTSLMLRTPGSYKDQHQAKWMTPCSIEEAILSYTDNCDVIEPQAPQEEQEQKFDELTAGLANKAIALIATHSLIKGNYYYTGENNGLLCLKRIQPSHCEICNRTHDASDAYVNIYRGNVYLRCYRDDTKGSVFLGFIGDAEPMKFRWADVKVLIKAQDKLKETGMSNKEMQGLAAEQKKLFAEAKKAAYENEAALLKVEKFYFTDFPKFHKKTFPNTEQVIRWINQTIAKIMMGGNSLYITSDFWKGSKHFTEMSLLPCSRMTDAYYINIINPRFDENAPMDEGKHAKNPMFLRVDFKDVINEHTMMDFYKAVDFVPYLIPPATDGYVYKKVYKCIHFDTKEELKMGMEENLKQYKHTKNYVQKWYAEHKNDTYDRDCGVKYWQYPVMGDIGNHESKYNATSQYYIDEGLKWLKTSIDGYKEKRDRSSEVCEDDLLNLDKCFSEAKIDTATRFQTKEKPSKEIFNMFEGYKFPYTEVKESPACVQPWIDHIHNIVCSGNADQAKTITQWLAHLIQKPTQKAYAVILYGGQGTGKSILYEFFTRCIGKDLGLQVGKLEDLTQTHNTHVRGKLIINANEATNEPCIRDVNILKGLITETDLIINPKGVNQYTVSNYSRLLITSNYKQCMRLDADDRRYFCLEISDAKKNNDAYFAPLVQSLTNEATQQAFFDYLSNYDISDFHHQRPPMSAMKRDMIGASADNVILFMKDVCENEVVGLEYEKDTVEITPTCADVFELYIVWCKANDEKGRRQNKTKFAEQLKGLFEIAVVRPRVNGGRERRFQIQRDVLLGKFKTLYMNDNFEYMVVE